MSLSSKLGPRARTLATSHKPNVVDSLVEVSRNSDLQRLARALRKAGAHEVYVSPLARTTGFIRVEVPADHLNALADVSDDVVYVEADDRSY